MIVQEAHQGFGLNQIVNLAMHCYVWSLLAKPLAKTPLQINFAGQPPLLYILLDQLDVSLFPLEKQELPMQITSSAGLFVLLIVRSGSNSNYEIMDLKSGTEEKSAFQLVIFKS